MRQLIYLALIAIGFAFYLWGDFNLMDEQGVLYACILSIIGLVVHIFTPEKKEILNRNFFKPSTFAVLGLVIVNLQLYIDFILGIADVENARVWANRNVVVDSAFLSSVGINSFLLGFSIYREKIKIPSIHKKISVVRIEHFLFLATITLGIYFATIDRRYIFGGYGTIELGIIPNYMALLFQLLIFAYIIQKVRNLYATGGVSGAYDYFRKMGYGVAILIFVYLVSVLLSGDRGPIIHFSLVYATGFFFLSKQKLKLGKAILFLLLASFILNLLRNVRNLGADIPFTEKLEIALLGSDDNEEEGRSISPSTSELAGSLRTLHYAVDYVEKGNEYTNGRFLFQQIMASVPFSSTFAPLIFDDLSRKYSSAAHYFTWIEQGDFPTSGVGSSVMASFFLDFGAVAVFLGLLTFGYIMNFLDHTLYRKGMPSLWVMSFLFTYVTVALYIARSDLFSDLKMVVWIYISLQINKLLMSRTQ